jgi:hypothetical protein
VSGSDPLLRRSSRLRTSSELDEILFGSTEMAERYFNLCVAVLEVIIKQIVAEFQKQVRGLNGFLSRHIWLRAERSDCVGHPEPSWVGGSQGVCPASRTRHGSFWWLASVPSHFSIA